MSKFSTKAAFDIPNRNGFDMSHENLFTATVGTLTPCLVEEVMPNETINLSSSLQVQLPPMATDFYGRVQGRLEAFFVPNRILVAGWQDMISRTPVDPTASPLVLLQSNLPKLRLPKSECGAGSLADYLGIKFLSSAVATTSIDIPNPLPFLAYHRIYHDYYRDSRVQKGIYLQPLAGTSVANNVRVLPYMRQPSNAVIDVSNYTYYDGVKLTALRQRLYDKDYFMNATLRPQASEAQTVNFTVDGVTHSGSFTIAQLREANALQQFMERNNMAGFKYADNIRANFGIYPSDSVLDSAIYLGSSRFDVYNKSVFQSANDPASANSLNPFSSVGAKYANSFGAGSGNLIDNFRSTEHGILMVLFSLVPLSYYTTGIRRLYKRSAALDFPWPSLSGIGDQEIYASEVDSRSAALAYATPFSAVDGETVFADKDSDVDPNAAPVDTTFGYNQRYSEIKSHPDEVHGLLRDGSSLSSFALTRGFIFDSSNGVAPQISLSVQQIQRTAMNNVTAVSSDMSNYGCWVDCYHNLRKSSPFSVYDIPTLGEPNDTHKEVIHVGGTRL